MFFAIFFGFFVGTMVKETHIQEVCDSYKRKPAKIKKLCGKQLANRIDEIERELK